jgi:hypothetical protein
MTSRGLDDLSAEFDTSTHQIRLRHTALGYTTLQGRLGVHRSSQPAVSRLDARNLALI